MDELVLAEATKASGAVAFVIDPETACFDADFGRLGLIKADYLLVDIIEKLAPAERSDFSQAVLAGEIDQRVRLVGEEGAVRIS